MKFPFHWKGDKRPHQLNHTELRMMKFQFGENLIAGIVRNCDQAGFRESGISRTLSQIQSVLLDDSPTTGVRCLKLEAWDANVCWCKFARWP